MTSAEQKAKGVISVELKDAVSRLLQLVAANRETLAVAEDLASHAITTAILEAENAKLEEAAVMLRHRALTHLPPDTQLIALCARAVRSLISKKEPVDLVGIGTAALERGLNSKPKD